jgi:hypothetical protein
MELEMATDSSDIGNPANQERLADIKENIEKWFDFFADNIDLSKENKRFLWGDQWEQHIADEYLSLGKVTLTFNILAPYQRRLSAEVRASTPALEVIPAGERNQANEQSAKILESVIRKIFLSSNAKRSFQIGFDNSSGGGYGALGYKNKFTDVNSFKQEIEVFPIPEPERCGWDPSAKEPTKCDGDYSFYVNTMSKKEFEKQFGFEPPVSADNSIFLENQFAWNDMDNVSVVDYYEKEYFSIPIVKMQNGNTVKSSELRQVEKFLDENPEMDNPQIRADIKVVDKRTATDYKIMNYTIMSDRILEKKEWGGKELRHVFVDGNSYFLEGEQFIQSFIKDAIDPQKFHNYVKSETVQNIKDSTKEDYIGTPANIEGNQKQWKDKRRRKGILLANPDPITGQLPIKQPPSQVNPQLLALGVEGDENVKSGLGVFDSNQGASSTDLSGKAENIRVTQGNLSSFVYIDNLNRSIEQVGKGVLSLFQAINSDTTTVQGLKEDGSQLTSQVNVPVFGGQVLNNISEGKFNVAIQASSSFAAQRDAEYQRILNYAQAFPVMQNTVQDLAAKKLNSDISSDIVARAELTLPPQIQAQNEDNPQLAKQAQQQMAQQQQQEQQQQQMAQMLVQMKATDDHIRALADQMGGVANIMNAQTNQTEAQTNGVIESAKILAEDERTKVEAEKDFRKASLDAITNLPQFGIPAEG